MARKQLTLPGLRRREPEPAPRAKRDFGAAEFERALERNGFRRVGDLAFEDQETHRLVRVREIRRDPIRIARRATLAQLLRFRADVHRKRTLKQSPAAVLREASVTERPVALPPLLCGVCHGQYQGNAFIRA